MAFQTYFKHLKSPAAKLCRYMSMYKTFPLFQWPGLSVMLEAETRQKNEQEKCWKPLSWAIQYVHLIGCSWSPTCEGVILNYTAWLLPQPLHPSQSIWIDPCETWVVILISRFEADSQMYYCVRAWITVLI